jgi:hypothetical protein
VAAAAALVVLRVVPLVAYEYIFDADQATVGLMAKHLSDGRTFPLFFYGQQYMLGVQAWMAAPLFLIGGPTLAMLRLPLAVINVAVAAGLLVLTARRGVRPIDALVATLPVVATVPAMSAELMFTLGASIEPFLYALGLWGLRRRPLAFGALAGFGILHREFTVFAVAAFAVAGWRTWRAWRPAGFARAAAALAAVWLLIDQLKRQTGIYGPDVAGAAPVSGSLALQAETVLKRLSFDIPGYLGRFGDVLTSGLPTIFGAGPQPLTSFGVNSTLSQGRDAAAWMLAGALAAAAARLLWAMRPAAPSRPGGDGFFAYVGLVGVFTIFAYGLGGGLPVGAPIVLAYLLFALLPPVGLLGAFFLRETSGRWRAGVAAAVVVWAACNVWDNGRLLVEFEQTPPRQHHRLMANYLESQGIRYGRALYWDAYPITFFSQERVIVTPFEVVRIRAYQAAVEAHEAEAVRLDRQPCTRGTRVDLWCVSR